MQLINLTPHTINVYSETGEPVATIEKSGMVARLDSVQEKVNEINGVPFYVTKFGAPYVDVDGERVQFPDLADGVAYVVSGMFRASFSRPDIWQPGELLRDAEGQPIGCVGLRQ